jgi:hypothetical protein
MWLRRRFEKFGDSMWCGIMWIWIGSSDWLFDRVSTYSSSVKEASCDQVNDYLLISQHKNALTGPAGYLNRRTAPMKAIVGESLAWLPVLEQAKNKTHTARWNMTVYCVHYTSVRLSKTKRLTEKNFIGWPEFISRGFINVTPVDATVE